MLLTHPGMIPLEKEMALHSSILAWEIPWTEEPGELQSRGSQRIWHDWVTEHTHTLEGAAFIVLGFLRPPALIVLRPEPVASSYSKRSTGLHHLISGVFSPCGFRLSITLPLPEVNMKPHNTGWNLNSLFFLVYLFLIDRFQLKLYTWSQDLVKLEFFRSRRRIQWETNW